MNEYTRAQLWAMFAAAAIAQSNLPLNSAKVADIALAEFDKRWSYREGVYSQKDPKLNNAK
jgi:hypothetical protein